MSGTDSTALVPVQVPGASMPIQTDGKRLAAFRPMVEYFGLDYSSQLQKLKSKSWATMAKITMVSGDGKVREMVGVDRRTTGGLCPTRRFAFALQDSLDTDFTAGALAECALP